jgi:cob(I)alamin adenosyltransferase
MITGLKYHTKEADQHKTELKEKPKTQKTHNVTHLHGQIGKSRSAVLKYIILIALIVISHIKATVYNVFSSDMFQLYNSFILLAKLNDTLKKTIISKLANCEL